MWMLRLIAVEQDQVHQGERDDAAVEYKRATPGANHSDGFFKLTRQNKQNLVYILFFFIRSPHARVANKSSMRHEHVRERLQCRCMRSETLSP